MYERILMPLDGSLNSKHSLAWGIGFAKTLDAQVTFLHVLDNLASYIFGLPRNVNYTGDMMQDLHKAGVTLLEDARRRATDAGVTCYTLMKEYSQPAGAILHAEDSCDLTIMATHSRRGLDRLFLGSVTEAVLRRSEKPHLILHWPDSHASNPATYEQAAIKHILVPVAEGAASESAVEESLRLARSLGAQVTFLHVLEVPIAVYSVPEVMVYDPHIHEGVKTGAQKVLDRAHRRALDMGVEADIRLIDSPYIRAETAILEAEGAFDLTIMASHGRRGLPRALLGSVTESVLRQSSLPHLIVRCSD